MRRSRQVFGAARVTIVTGPRNSGGRGAVRRAMEIGVAVLVVDEIGPLEVAGGGLWEPVRDAVAAFGGHVILTVRPSLLDALRERLGLNPSDLQVVAPGTIPSIA